MGGGYLLIYGVVGLLGAGIGVNRWRGVRILYFIEERCVTMVGVLAGSSHNFIFSFSALMGFLVPSLLSRHVISYRLEYNSSFFVNRIRF